MRYYLVSIHNGRLEYLTQRGATSPSPRHAARYPRARAVELRDEVLAGSTMGPFAMLRVI